MKQNLHPILSIRVYNDEKCFGPGIAELLEGVEARRSLRAAAQGMHMAYSKAWTTVRSCEAALGFQLLVYTTGGRNGGGASLTPRARALLDAYRAYCQALREQADRLFQAHFAPFLPEDTP
ncbi:MAG: LysR family transcriptional regulator [Oscillospiraceae bacterium]|nr:LysR family transcriptional regulator [Oscillospiraceae bacterium]